MKPKQRDGAVRSPRRNGLPGSTEPGRTKIAIVGTGLIGTSIGLALRRTDPKVRVIGYDRRVAVARGAARRRALTSIAASLEEAVTQADVTVLAIPQAGVIAVLPRVFAAARPGSLVLDVAGLKTGVVQAAAPLLAGSKAVAFAAGHPVAGSERSGPRAASADLFRERPFALCVPAQRKRQAVLRRAASFARSIGARPLPISARDHDRIVAATSALPQLVASAVALAAAGTRGPRGLLTGPGLEGVIRLAATPASLWNQALITNKRNVLAALDVFEARLRGFRRAIECGDRARLGSLLRSGAVSQRRLRSS